MRASKVHRLLPVLSLLAGGLLLPGEASAQFAMKQKYLGAHVGVSGVGSAAALGVNGEIAYNDRIGIGAWLDTWSYGDSYTTVGGNYDWDVRYIALAGTGAYHFPVKSTPKLDPFLGLALGYYVVNSKADGFAGVTYAGSASRVFLGAFGGARYAFKENLSGVARLGFGASYLTVGLDLKM
jgi:hypothetical protein